MAISVAWKFRKLLLAFGIDHEDARLDLFAHIWSVRDAYDATRGPYNSYCYLVARSHLMHRIDHLRVRWRRMSRFQIPKMEARYADEMEQRESIRLLMASMSVRERSFVSDWLAGKPMRAIGRKRGLSVERVRQLIKRGLKQARTAAGKAALDARCGAEELWLS